MFVRIEIPRVPPSADCSWVGCAFCVAVRWVSDCYLDRRTDFAGGNSRPLQCWFPDEKAPSSDSTLTDTILLYCGWIYVSRKWSWCFLIPSSLIFFFFFSLCDGISLCCSGWSGLPGLRILLPQALSSWNYQYVPPHLSLRFLSIFWRFFNRKILHIFCVSKQYQSSICPRTCHRCVIHAWLHFVYCRLNHLSPLQHSQTQLFCSNEYSC